jgi:DsbC/DsbD-like thiol-disulfide interchange protein
MTRLKLLALACLSALALACSGGTATNSPAADSNAAGAAASPPAPPAEMVRVEAAGVETTRGASAGGEVRLSVVPGFHVNANPASEKYLIPTELKIEPAEGVEIGPVAYPESVTRQFSFSEKPLAVYEGDARIKFALKVLPNASTGAQTLRARLRYQACDDAQCYPPKTVELTVPVSVN